MHRQTSAVSCNICPFGLAISHGRKMILTSPSLLLWRHHLCSCNLYLKTQKRVCQCSIYKRHFPWAGLRGISREENNTDLMTWGTFFWKKNQHRILKPENLFYVSLLNRLIQNQLKESTLSKDSSVLLMHHDPGLICLVKKNKICFSDLRVQFWIFPKEHTLKEHIATWQI